VQGLVPVMQKAGWEVIWDEALLQHGDEISTFCNQVRSTPFMLPVIADSYLKKLWCLTEFFSFYKEQGSERVRFAERCSKCVEIGQISPQREISNRVAECRSYFEELTSKYPDLDCETKEQIASILRECDRTVANVASPMSNLLGMFDDHLATFGLETLAANNYAAVMTNIEHTYDKFHAKRRA